MDWHRRVGFGALYSTGGNGTGALTGTISLFPCRLPALYVRPASMLSVPPVHRVPSRHSYSRRSAGRSGVYSISARLGSAEGGQSVGWLAPLLLDFAGAAEPSSGNLHENSAD